MAKARKLLDGYVETKAVASDDVLTDLFALTGYGISFAKGAGYAHCAATRRDPSDYTFQLTLSGRGVFERDGEAEYLTPGRGFLCDVRNDTGYRYYYPEDGEEPWTFIYLQFRGSSATEIARRLIARYGNVFAVAADLPLFAALPKCGNGHRTVLIPSSRSAGIVMSLLRELSASAEREDSNVGYERVVGMPANEYLHARVLNCIVNQLSFSDRSVKDIAESLGFVSVNTMLRMFRNRLGRYPAVLRDEMRDGADRKSLRLR